MKTKIVISQKLFPVFASVLAASLLVSCTNEKPSTRVEGPAVTTPPSSSNAAAATSAKPAALEACTTEDVAPFDRADGEVVDLERETLPRGLYLATVSALLIEKKNEAAPLTRVVVQETAGGKGEISCAEELDRLGEDFELNISGLVKFQTDERPHGGGFVSRQFFFYQDKTGYGAILSNPHLSGLAQKPEVDLKTLLKGNAQLVRYNERSYALKYSREREGMRARLVIRLELIPH